MRALRRARTWALAIVGTMLVSSVHAADVAVAGRSLIVTVNDVNGRARLVSLQKSGAITKGTAGDVAQLSGSLEVYYVDTPANAASLALPSPWFRNEGAVARFRNPLAPSGPTVVKAATVRAGSTAKVVAKGLGGLSIASPPGSGGVLTVFTLVNGNDSSTHRFCSRYSTADGSTVSHQVTASGFKLRLRNGAAVPCPTCGDGIRNAAESDVDCGGGACPDCAAGDDCAGGEDCESGVCAGNVCQAATCGDATLNGDETDVDCGGGACPACGTGLACEVPGDCQSGLCAAGVCILPPCANGVQDGDESDVDCGGGTCPACGPGDLCADGPDCDSLVCFANVCQAPTCTDSTRNADETDVDCGGSCPGCPDGDACQLGGDCASGVCTANVCQAPTCSDGVQNRDELGADCGGFFCPVCSCVTRGQCLMFVTSTSSGANLGGLAGADSTCNTRAAAAGLIGNFQAWLCDGVTAPADRSVRASVPYRRTDGALIANDWADLTDGSLSNPINRTELGGDVSGSAPFLPWTLVTAAGTCDNETYLSPGSGPCPAFSNCKTNCANNGGNNGWTSSSGLAQGSKGDINATGGSWTDGATGLCSTPAERIYCIEQ